MQYCNTPLMTNSEKFSRQSDWKLVKLCRAHMTINDLLCTGKSQEIIPCTLFSFNICVNAIWQLNLMTITDSDSVHCILPVLVNPCLEQLL